MSKNSMLFLEKRMILRWLWGSSGLKKHPIKRQQSSISNDPCEQWLLNPCWFMIVWAYNYYPILGLYWGLWLYGFMILITVYDNYYDAYWFFFWGLSSCIVGIPFLARCSWKNRGFCWFLNTAGICGEYSLCRKLRTVQLKACDAGKASNVASLLQEAKDAKDPVRGMELLAWGSSTWSRKPQNPWEFSLVSEGVVMRSGISMDFPISVQVWPSIFPGCCLG